MMKGLLQDKIEYLTNDMEMYIENGEWEKALDTSKKLSAYAPHMSDLDLEVLELRIELIEEALLDAS